MSLMASDEEMPWEPWIYLIPMGIAVLIIIAISAHYEGKSAVRVAKPCAAREHLSGRRPE